MLGDMGKGRRWAGPRVKYVQPGYRNRAPAAPPGPAERIERLSPSPVLERIRRARIQRQEAEAELALLVDRAVALGIGWPGIAARLGVSRQTARQHYQRRHRGEAGGMTTSTGEYRRACKASGGTLTTNFARFQPAHRC
jgi:hypothetical protein